MQILTYIYYDVAISLQLSIQHLLFDKTLLSFKEVILPNLLGPKWSTIWGPKGWLIK